jgi:glutamate racemase
MTQQAIGVFDSGMGGLTVLKALRQTLPNESFIYLGDTARLPYGTKSLQTVQNYAVQMARILVEKNIKALVIACNTATTAALVHLQTILPDLPVMGVVIPGAGAAVAATKNQRIAVLATETTITSQAYQNLIYSQLPNAKIHALSCSILVSLAEDGMTDNAIAHAAISHYLADLTEEDTILLGCTHFPIFKPLLSKVLPQHINIVDSAESTAIELKKILQQANLLNTGNSSPYVQYLVTDSVQRFQKVGSIFLNENLSHDDILLIDV